ncbi:MAG: PKD domain-containing protein [Pseudomonadota bacterium]
MHNRSIPFVAAGRSSHWRTALLATLLAACLATTARAQIAPDWSALSAATQGVALAVDTASHSYAASSVANGAITLTRRSPAGQTLWQRSLASAGALSRSTSVVADAAGHAIVTGYLVDGAGTAQGAVVAKFDSAGNLLWQEVTPGAQGHAWRAGTDSSGNVLVLSRQARAGSTVMDMVLTRYTATGQRQWARSVGARHTGSDTPLLVSPSGLAVVTGSGDLSGQELLAAFDAAGNQVWAKTIASSGPLGLALGRSGEVVAVGTGGLGFLVVKHDAAFNELWRNSYAASGGALRAVVDAGGNLLVSGVTDARTGPLTVVLNDWLTLKLDPNGNLLWQHQLGSTTNGDDVPAGLAVAADGAAYLTGRGMLTTLDSAGTATTRRSTLTLKLGSDGGQRWLANTATTLRGVALQLGSDGGVLVLGDSTQLLPGDGTQALLRYPQSGLPNQAPVALATASPASGPAPLVVAFSAAAASDPDGSIASWHWDFGDGTSADTASASHTYAAVGSYSARLTVTDTLGASTVSAPLPISASALAPAKPSGINLASSSVLGGQPVTATVQVSSTAGVTLLLSSSNASLARVPASVVVPPGSDRVSVVISTSKPRKNTTVTIKATANGGSASAALTVRAK